MSAAYPRFADYASRIAALPAPHVLTIDDLLVADFRVYTDGRLEIYYTPFDYVNERAKLTLIGITPGEDQMWQAYRAARAALGEGLPAHEALLRADQQASFAGRMRENLIAMLDGIGLPALLDIPSSRWLFGHRSDLVNTTSAVRDAVFVANKDGKYVNYTGHSPKLLQKPVLRGYVDGPLAEELQQTADALLVALGEGPSEAVQYLIDRKVIDPARCLLHFPHPSGANDWRTRHFAERRDQLCAQASAWFRAHA